jgi:hypothetical protein
MEPWTNIKNMRDIVKGDIPDISSQPMVGNYSYFSTNMLAASS